MNLLRKLNLSLLCAVLIFAACGRENVDEIIPKDPEFEPRVVKVNSLFSAMETKEAAGVSLGCILIEYPFTVELETEDQISIDSEQAFKTAMEQEAPNRVADLVYPLSILENGEPKLVQNNQELGSKYASCVPTRGWQMATTNGSTPLIPAYLFDNYCFDLVYPVDLQDSSGTAYVATSDSQFIDLVTTIQPLFFSTPFTVDSSGTQFTINNLNEFIDIVYSCDDVNPPVAGPNGFEVVNFACYELVYPVDVIVGNGPVQQVNDGNEYFNLILSGLHVELQLPFSLQDSAGGITVVNDIEDLLDVLTACGLVVVDTTTNNTACNTPAHALLFFNTSSIQCRYSINYPVQVEAEGVTYNLNNLTEYLDVYNMYSRNIDAITLLYNVSITLQSDGSTTTFTSDTELCNFIDGC